MKIAMTKHPGPCAHIELTHLYVEAFAVISPRIIHVSMVRVGTVTSVVALLVLSCQ